MENLLSIVLELPPAPAALVLLGRWLETFSARSAAAFLRMTVAGPPGGLGDAGRAVVEPDAALLTGEVGRGADCGKRVSYRLQKFQLAWYKMVRQVHSETKRERSFQCDRKGHKCNRCCLALRGVRYCGRNCVGQQPSVLCARAMMSN